MSEIDKTDDTNTEDNGMTDGVPSAVSDLIDKINEDNKDEVEYEEVDDGTTEEDKNTDDTTTKDSTDDSTDNDTGDTGDDAVEDTGIVALGWDADTVQKLNELDPNLVKDVEALLKRGSVEKSSADDDTQTSEKKIKTVEIKGQITDEQLEALEKENPAMAAIVKSLSSQVGELSESLNSVAEDEKMRTEEAEKKAHYSNFRTTNRKLDELEKDFPIFGTFDKLPMDANGVPDDRHRSVRERALVWGKAQALHSTGAFGSFEESLESAITLYRGEKGENLAMRKVAKDLNSRSKQMTTRPNRTKTKLKTPKKGTDAFMEKVVDDAMKAAGVTE